MPESTGGGGISEERFMALVARVDALELALEELRNSFALW